jgi:hypothetical protein
MTYGTGNFMRTYKRNNRDDVRFDEGRNVPRDRKRDKKRSKEQRRLIRKLKLKEQEE